MPSLSPSDSLSGADGQPSPAAPAAAMPGRLSRGEIAVIVVALLALAWLRWMSVTSHRWNSDEPQHLHVVWGWTAGYIQYKDYFDNHTPLFQMLSAPLFASFGERGDIVVLMRRAMFPICGLAIGCVYLLGTRLYDRRTGWFAALIAALLPAFFYRMGEFRTDVGWTTAWLATLTVALCGKLTPWRTFAAALLVGATFSISMKSTLLVFCAAVSGIITWWLAGWPLAKAWPRHAAAFLAGLVIIPGALLAYFASKGALDSLYYCVIAHNTMPGRNLGHMMVHQFFSRISIWLTLAGTGLGVWAMLPAVRRDPERGYRKLFLFLYGGTFFPLLRGCWPAVTTQDFLPWLPVLPIFAVAGWTLVRARVQSRWPFPLPWVIAPLLLLIGECVWIVWEEPPQRKSVDSPQITNLAAILRLIDKGEYILDSKGESIYRPRPTYLVFESLTREQVRSGHLKDDTLARLIETGTTAVRANDKRMTPEVMAFLKKHYTRVLGCNVLGHRLHPKPGAPLTFDIIIPQRYAIIGPDGPLSGRLDGQPLDGPRQLEPGQHELIITQTTPDAFVIWARALERGFTPYPPYYHGSIVD